MRAVLLSLALLVGAGCAAGQDPEITPGTGAGPSTTSHGLQPCPPGGPDATTPPAGCLDDAGAVQRP